VNASFEVFGLSTGIIRSGDSVAERAADAADRQCGGIHEGDILVFAEKAVAKGEGNIIVLATINPSPHAEELGIKYQMDPRTAEVVLRESDSIVGGIPGFLLCMKAGTLLPNAGVDASNAPLGCVTPLPKNPDQSALTIKIFFEYRYSVKVGVIIADSRTHAMRLGCSGVAIGCAGITAVIDDRGRNDLFGRKLEVTKRAVGDNIVSAAELVMGEADECTQAAIVRGIGLPIGDQIGIDSIAAEECLFMGVFAKTRMQE